MIKKYLSTLSLCLMMTLSVNAQEETQQSLLPINEPLTENTGSFTNAVLMTGTNVNGIVATGGKGTATLSLDTDPDAEGVQAYAVAENERHEREGHQDDKPGEIVAGQYGCGDKRVDAVIA